MKKRFSFVVVILSLLVVVGCGRKNSEEIGSMSQPSEQVVAFLAHMDQWVADYPSDKIDAEDFSAEIYETWPGADLGITNHFMRRGTIDPDHFTGLEYHYFKDGKCEMQDSTGNYVPVKISGSNGFVIRFMTNDDPDDDIWVSLACSNGMMNIRRTSDVSTSRVVIEFTIQKGKGLAYYLNDNLWSVVVAETFGLHIYEGRGYRNRINYERARTLAGQSDIIQTTVKVRPGWKFRIDGNVMQIRLPGEDWMTPAQFRAAHVNI